MLGWGGGWDVKVHILYRLWPQQQRYFSSSIERCHPTPGCGILVGTHSEELMNHTLMPILVDEGWAMAGSSHSP